MKILLIGGSGYIGTAVSKFFTDKKNTVHIFDNFIYQNENHLQSFFKKNKLIKIYSNNFSKILKDNNYDLIVILSGLVGDPITKKYPKLSHKHNNVEIKNYLKIINLNYDKKLVFISTCSNYGLTDGNILLNEDSNLKPLSLYAKDKVDIENFILKNEWRFHYTILRFATAFGHSPRMRFDLTVNEFTKFFFLKIPFEVYDADTWRPYCHIKDFARALETIHLANINIISGQVFNVGSTENNFTKRSIVEKINEFFDYNFVIYKEKGSDKRNYKVDFSKINKLLNFKPKYSLSNGIEEIVNNLNTNSYENLNNYNLYGNYNINNL